MRSSICITGLMSLAALVAAAPCIRADTIYQTNPQGRQEILQRDAIVVKQDRSVLIYKHFDLQERRVEKVQLGRRSLPYIVVTSTPQDRQRIVAQWKRFGYTATVTDASGKITRVFDAYIDFFPSAGQGSFFEAVPAVTSFTVQLTGGGADSVQFSQIAQVQIQNGAIKLRLRDGRIEEGKFIIPTSQPADVRFLGITNAYNPASEDVFDFSRLLSHLKEIRFEP
jgi:hypothetical protein